MVNASSAMYDQGVSELEEVGFTAVPSVVVKVYFNLNVNCSIQCKQETSGNQELPRWYYFFLLFFFLLYLYSIDMCIYICFFKKGCWGNSCNTRT